MINYFYFVFSSSLQVDFISKFFYPFRLHVNSYRIYRPNTNGWLHSNIRTRSASDTFENDAQPTFVMLEKQSKLRNSVFKGDPREFLG